MIRKYVLPLLAALGIVLAVYTVRAGSRQVPAAVPVARPPEAPFASYIAGAGLIEASTENIAIGTSVPGVVNTVTVKVGDDVARGQPLMTIDARDLEAQLVQRQAVLATRRAQLEQLRQLPRVEDVPPAEARVGSAQAELGDAQAKLEAYEAVPDKRAITTEEMTRRRFAVTAAQAKLAEQAASLAKLKAGAWKPDVDAAGAQVAAAEADIAALQIEIDRRIVRAPVDGRVLQVKVRAGEYAPAGVLQTPLMLIGDVRTLNVRIDVDENDAWRIKPNAKARASVRGNGRLATDLTFVRVEPYILPKRSLTGDSSERVDTRVLQLIYAFPAGTLPVYVGQQMDVFMESSDPTTQPRASATASPHG